MISDENMTFEFAKVLSYINSNLESLIKKVDGCENNPEILSIICFIRVFNFYKTII